MQPCSQAGQAGYEKILRKSKISFFGPCKIFILLPPDKSDPMRPDRGDWPALATWTRRHPWDGLVRDQAVPGTALGPLSANQKPAVRAVDQWEAELSMIWQPGSLSVLRTWRERNQASSGARPGVRLVTLFYQTNILLFVSRQIMVPARGLPPAQHLALLYDDQSLQKELSSPWNKADKIGRQWRCCSLSLVSPLSPESPRNVERESLTGSASRVRSQEPASADQISQDNYTLWFQNANSRKKKFWQGRRRSVIYLDGFSQQLHVIPALFKPWRKGSNVYLSPSYCHGETSPPLMIVFAL